MRKSKPEGVRIKSYRQLVREAKARAVRNCECRHLVIICPLCSKIHGSEVDKKEKGEIGQAYEGNA